jgi:hypothetical protein
MWGRSALWHGMQWFGIWHLTIVLPVVALDSLTSMFPGVSALLTHGLDLVLRAVFFDEEPYDCESTEKATG